MATNNKVSEYKNLLNHYGNKNVAEVIKEWSVRKKPIAMGTKNSAGGFYCLISHRVTEPIAE